MSDSKEKWLKKNTLSGLGHFLIFGEQKYSLLSFLTLSMNEGLLSIQHALNTGDTNKKIQQSPFGGAYILLG